MEREKEKGEGMKWEKLVCIAEGCLKTTNYELHKKNEEWALYHEAGETSFIPITSFPKTFTPSEAQAAAEKVIKEREEREMQNTKQHLPRLRDKAVQLRAHAGFVGSHCWSTGCDKPACSPHLLTSKPEVDSVFHGMHASCGSESKDATVDFCCAVMKDGSLRFADSHKVGNCPFMNYEEKFEEVPLGLLKGGYFVAQNHGGNYTLFSPQGKPLENHSDGTYIFAQNEEEGQLLKQLRELGAI